MQYIELTPAVHILEDRGHNGQSCSITDIYAEYVELMCEEATHDMTALATRYWRAYRSHNWLWEILRVGNEKNPLFRALKENESSIPFLLDTPNGPEVFSQEIVSAWGNLSGLAKPGETLLTFNSFDPDTDVHDICDTAVEKELLLAFHSYVTRVILDCLSIFYNERTKRVSNMVNSPYAQRPMTGEQGTGEPCTMLACVVEDYPTTENEIAVRVLFGLLNVTGIFQTPMTEEQKERADMRKVLRGKRTK